MCRECTKLIQICINVDLVILFTLKANKSMENVNSPLIHISSTAFLKKKQQF